MTCGEAPSDELPANLSVSRSSWATAGRQLARLAQRSSKSADMMISFKPSRPPQVGSLFERIRAYPSERSTRRSSRAALACRSTGRCWTTSQQVMTSNDSAANGSANTLPRTSVNPGCRRARPSARRWVRRPQPARSPSGSRVVRHPALSRNRRRARATRFDHVALSASQVAAIRHMASDHQCEDSTSDRRSKYAVESRSIESPRRASALIGRNSLQGSAVLTDLSSPASRQRHS